jgi:hypothetical protein
MGGSEKRSWQCQHSRAISKAMPPFFLVRAALSFSKKLAHHIGVIKLFICHDNLTRAAA